MQTITTVRLRPMTEDDIHQVVEIERESFPTSWPLTAYRRELANKAARYFVLAAPQPGPPAAAVPPPSIWEAVRRIIKVSDPAAPAERIEGFIGVWLVVREAHIVTVAVRESLRRRGLGERLLIAAIDLALETAQAEVTLEVRASNIAAQRMYEKYGFDVVGVRKRYYTDDNEDALVMTATAIGDLPYRERFAARRHTHRLQHPGLWA